jgi:hypothetical protein
MPVVDECRNHDIDIPSATLTGALTIAGLPASADPNARLLLRNGLNDLVEIPFTGPSYAVRVAPGSYDVFFAATGSTTSAPMNQLARLHTAFAVPPSGTTTLDVDVPATIVAGVVTLNGAAPAADDVLNLSLRNAAGDIVKLASTGTGSYAALVVPGTYDVYFSSSGDPAAGSAAPRNQLARIARGVVVPPTFATRLDIDVPSATVTGAVVVNGLPAGAEDAVNMILRSATGDIVAIALTNGASYAIRVVPGTYDLHVGGTGGGLSVANQNARLRTGVVVNPTGTTVLNIDVPSATVEGRIRLNGTHPGEDNAHLLLRTAAGDQASLPWTSDGAYSVRLVPGTYDLVYSQGEMAGATTPRNQLAKLRTVVVAATGTTRLDVDIASTVVTGALRINGAPANAGVNSAIAWLGAPNGDRVTIANTVAPTFSTRVMPGTYDLYYTRTAGPANTTTPAPANHAAKLREGVVIGAGPSTAFDIDIPSTTVSGRITINGAAAGPGDHGTMMLRSADGDYATFASTNADSYTARLIPGTYDLYFSYAGSVGDSTPKNTLVKLRCFTVP